MNKTRLYLGMVALILTCLPIIAHAVTVPSGILNYYTVNLVNTNSLATPDPFQPNIPFNCQAWNQWTNGNCNNYEVFYDNGVLVNSYLDFGNSNTYSNGMMEVSINGLTGNGLGRDNVRLNIGFASMGSNDVNGVVTGWASYLGGVCNGNNNGYGACDNGQTVFPLLYNAMGGTTRNSIFSSSGSPSQSNGLTIGPDAGQYFTPTVYGYNSGQILEIYATFPASIGAQHAGIGFSDTNFGGSTRYLFDSITGLGCDTSVGVLGSGATMTCTGVASGTRLWSIQMPDGTAKSDTFSWNYGGVNTLSAGSPSTTLEPIMLGDSGAGSSVIKIYTVRLRQYPNNGFAFITTNSGIISGASTTPTLTYTGSNSIPYPTTTTATATCQTGDSCAIDNPLGVHLCTGTTTCNYNTLVYPIGTNTFYANDISTVMTSSNVLTITQGTPTITCTHNSASIGNGGASNSLANNELIQCTIGSRNNEVRSGNLIYNNIIQSSGNVLSYNALWNNQNTLVISNTLTTANYLTNSISFNINSIPYLFTSVSANTPNIYETSNQPYQYNLQFTAYATSANLIWSMNSVFVQNVLQSVSTTNQIFQVNYHPSIIQANAIVNTYNGAFNVLLSNGITLNLGVINTLTQTTIWDYIPTLSTNTINMIEGSPITFNVVLSDLGALNQATYGGNLQIGTQNTIVEKQLSNYNFFTTIASFVSSAYGYPMPIVGTPNVVTVNALVSLSFQGNTVTRNLIGNNAISFNAFLPSLGTCTGGGGNYPTNGIIWYARTVPNLTIFTGNAGNYLFLTGNYQVVNGNYNASINGTNAGLPSPAGSDTSNTYSTCIYPAWANFKTNGQFGYNALTSATSGYMLIGQAISNTITNIGLYLATVTNPVTYAIGVQNLSTSTYIASTVQVLQQIPNSNNAVLINEIQTSAGQTQNINLNIGSKYRFAVYSNSGQFLTFSPTGGFIVAQTCTTQPCLYVIKVGNSIQQPDLIQLGLNIKYNCIPANHNTSVPVNFVTTITCTWTSLNGTSYPFTLLVKPNTVLNTTVACSNSASGATGSLACTVNRTNNTLYTWWFKLSPPASNYAFTIQFGSFGKAVSLFGLNGIYWALVLMMFLVLLFVSKNVFVSLMMAGVGIVASFLIGLITASVIDIGAVIGIIVVIGYIISRE